MLNHLVLLTWQVHEQSVTTQSAVTMSVQEEFFQGDWRKSSRSKLALLQREHENSHHIYVLPDSLSNQAKNLPEWPLVRHTSRRNYQDVWTSRDLEISRSARITLTAHEVKERRNLRHIESLKTVFWINRNISYACERVVSKCRFQEQDFILI